MTNTQEVARLTQQLSDARRKHLDAKKKVSDLQGRVGSNSFMLSDAKRDRFHCKAEVTRLEKLLKDHGLSNEAVAAISASEPTLVDTDSATA